MIYNPDCIPMWLYQKYTEKFAPVLAATQLTVPVATVMPSVTPVCFGTMYNRRHARRPRHSVLYEAGDHH